MVSIVNSELLENSALYGSVFFINNTSLEKSTIISVENSKFENNFAQISGSLVFIQSLTFPFKIKDFSNPSNSSKNNSALRSNGTYSSSPCTLEIISVLVLDEETNDTKRMTTIYPGQPFSISFVLYDIYGRVIIFPNTIKKLWMFIYLQMRTFMEHKNLF